MQPLSAVCFPFAPAPRQKQPFQRALHRTVLMFVFHWCVSILCTRKIKDTQCGENLLYLCFPLLGSLPRTKSMKARSYHSMQHGREGSKRKISSVPVSPTDKHAGHAPPPPPPHDTVFKAEHPSELKRGLLLVGRVDSKLVLIRGSCCTAQRRQVSSCLREIRPPWCSGLCIFSDGRSTPS